MKNFKDYFYEGSPRLLSEYGVDLTVKCSVPRLMGQKYLPILKEKKFKIEMADNGIDANIRVSTINDIINMMKEIDKDILFEQNGDVLIIMEKSPQK